ncbi:MAG: hypothetical protein ACJAY8_000777 [Sphingobacteriales bacterium]|jgi:hypothetical protein
MNSNIWEPTYSLKQQKRSLFMLENTPEIIVVTGIQPWDLGIGSNCRNSALELSKNHRVMYVDPPLGLKYFLFQKSPRT